MTYTRLRKSIRCVFVRLWELKMLVTWKWRVEKRSAEDKEGGNVLMGIRMQSDREVILRL